ncbi:cyclin-dependent kinase 2-like [Oratosquilla oratoria]|uniref:cyclin-dependent kinase 2-like n=1 Tax=Oratosquilla oratoria TaxID=337810 RepID=UPI003F75F835
MANVWKGTFNVICNPHNWGVKGDLFHEEKWTRMYKFWYLLKQDETFMLKTFRRKWWLRRRNRDVAILLFQNESNILPQLHHPNIIHLVDCRLTLCTSALVFPKLNWTTQKYIEKHNHQGLEVHVAREWIRYILRGLEYLHNSARLIHRNVHPGVIYVHNNGRICLGGLEYACFGGRGNKGFIIWVEKEGFRAPETLLKNIVPTCAVDIFSTGATLFYFLHGFSPFKGIRSMKTMSRVKVDKLLDTSHGEACVELLRAMMQYAANRRPTAEDCLRHPFIQESEQAHDVYEYVKCEKDSQDGSKASSTDSQVYHSASEKLEVSCKKKISKVSEDQ